MDEQQRKDALRAKYGIKKPPNRRNRAVITIFVLLFLIACFVVGIIVAVKVYMPNYTERTYYKTVERGDPDQFLIVLDDKPIPSRYGAVSFKDDTLIDRDFITDYGLDKLCYSSIFWHGTEKILIVSNPFEVIKMKPDEAFYTSNGLISQFEADNTGLLYDEDGDKVYLPLSFVRRFFGVGCAVSDTSKMVIIDGIDGLKNYRSTKVKPSGGIVRYEADIKSDIAEKVPKGENVTLFGEPSGDFRKVRTQNGTIGYIKEKELVANDTKKIVRDIVSERTPPLPERFRGKKISIVWEQIGEGTIKDWIYSKNPVIDIVSPTWFSIADENGGIKDIGSAKYVNYAKQTGYEVWPLFSNSFDGDLTSANLSTTTKRQVLIDNALSLCHKYKLTGVNVDFESYGYEDGVYVTQFIKELCVALRINGITSSVDLTFPTDPNSPTDREEIGKYADYAAIMAYDQHWAASQTAGPVAGYDWVVAGIEKTAALIPNEKMLLGLPLYTRVWYTPKEGGKVSSRDFAMDSAYSLFMERNAQMDWDDDTKYNNAHYEYDVEGVPTVIRAWLETDETLKHKANLINEYNLAGGACWKKGLESEGFFGMLGGVLGR